MHFGSGHYTNASTKAPWGQPCATLRARAQHILRVERHPSISYAPGTYLRQEEKKEKERKEGKSIRTASNMRQWLEGTSRMHATQHTTLS